MNKIYLDKKDKQKLIYHIKNNISWKNDILKFYKKNDKVLEIINTQINIYDVSKIIYEYARELFELQFTCYNFDSDYNCLGIIDINFTTGINVNINQRCHLCTPNSSGYNEYSFSLISKNIKEIIEFRNENTLDFENTFKNTFKKYLQRNMLNIVKEQCRKNHDNEVERINEFVRQDMISFFNFVMKRYYGKNDHYIDMINLSDETFSIVNGYIKNNQFEHYRKILDHKKLKYMIVIFKIFFSIIKKYVMI